MPVVRVSPAGRGDVYDLAVEHPDHAFTVNGGVTVSNCYDALRYLVAELEATPAPGSTSTPAPAGRDGTRRRGDTLPAATASIASASF